MPTTIHEMGKFEIVLHRPISALFSPFLPLHHWRSGEYSVLVEFTAQCYILGQRLPKTAAFDAVFDAVAPRRARDRVPSILALGLFLPVSDFTQPENGLPTPPLPFPYTGCHQTASYSPKWHRSVSAPLAARCR